MHPHEYEVKPTEEQMEEARRLMYAGVAFLKEAAEEAEARWPNDNPACLQAAHEALDQFDRNELAEAELRERITEEQRRDINNALEGDGDAAKRIDPEVHAPSWGEGEAF